MAAEIKTPTDHLTGLPLPILPQEVLPIDKPAFANRHHHWHPKSAPELQTLGGLALRQSRLQVVRATDHNVRPPGSEKPTYHDIYHGPELPSSESEQFKLCVLACASYVPDQAIDLGDGEPRVVRMTEKQKRILRTVGRVQPVTERKLIKLRIKATKAYQEHIGPNLSEDAFVDDYLTQYVRQQTTQAGFNYHHFTYGYEPVRDFFKHYALSQDISGIREHEIEEFLITKNEERKKFLGHKMLAYAIEEATESIMPVYKIGLRAGRMHPKVPHNPRRLVRDRLGRSNHREELSQQLEQRLRIRVGLS